MNNRLLLFLSLVILATGKLCAQNYDEALVPPYTLPPLLTAADGTAITTARQWRRTRRPELMRLLAEYEYGFTPEQKIKVNHQIVHENKAALDGRATMQQVRFTFQGEGRTVEALLLVYIPNHRKGRVPVFVGYNFKGNHSTTADTAVLLSPYFEHGDEVLRQRATQTSRWPYEQIIDHGYAVATMCYHDIYPDHRNGESQSVLALFPHHTRGQAHSWQALGAWAWGSSRIADWVERQSWAHPKRLVVVGHSRQGKAALWAGAQDERWAVTISNDSGCGGAALSRREFGETVDTICKNFPHWFCRRFASYGQRVAQLPLDQHSLLATIAPRALYVASAQDDLWADPRGEYLSAYHAGPAYQLLGKEPLTTPTPPAIHQPQGIHVGYHIRAGKHDVTSYDWQCFIRFCNQQFGR